MWDSIEDEESLCTIGNKELIFTLKKRKTDIEWPSLETLDLTKELKMQRRNYAFESMQNLNIEKSKKNSGLFMAFMSINYILFIIAFIDIFYLSLSMPNYFLD